MLRPTSAPESPSAAQNEGRRILVLFESGAAGVAAVELACELASREPATATVTVVGIAPQSPRLWGCAPSAHDYNATVRDTVSRELERADELLWVLGRRAESRLLVEGEDPPLEEVVARGGFALVLLPERRRLLRAAGHPAASRLRASGGPEVRIVGPASRASGQRAGLPPR